MAVYRLFASRGHLLVTSLDACLRPSQSSSPFCRLAVVASVLAIGVSGAVAQEPPTLPDNWQGMAADQFAIAAEQFFADGGEAESSTGRQLIQHAWDQFLRDEQFISDGEWSTVHKVVDLFGWRRRYLVTGDTLDEEIAAQLQVDSDEAVLKTRLAQRMSRDQVVIGASFEELKALRHTMKDNEFTDSERASSYADWMDANDWQALSIVDQFDLFDGLSADKLDRRKMSARWTGTLQAPNTDDYTLMQLRQYAVAYDSILKVWIDGNLVLDSTPGGEDDDARFHSEPVRLADDRPVAFRAEFIHNIDHDPSWYSFGSPMAALAWQADSIDEEVIPAAAFSPPAGFGDENAQGLKAEYFAGTNVGATQPTEIRLDPGIQFVWTWGPVCGEQSSKQDTILTRCRADMLDSVFLRSLETPEAKDAFLHSPAWRFTHYLPFSDRKQFVLRLTEHPALLGSLNAYGMGKLMESVYMLPGDAHLELLEAWCETRAQPRVEMGPLPGHGDGRYETLNTEYYWLISHFFQGPYWDDLKELSDRTLRRPDGECNLSLARVMAFAAFTSRNSKEFRERLESEADATGLTGDQRMTWLLAQGFAAEVMVASSPKPFRAIPFIEEATLVAQSNDYRFWATQELVARHGAAGHLDRLTEIISQRASTFALPEQQDLLANWTTQAETIGDEYADLESQFNRRRLEAYIRQLKRRLASATQSNREQSIQRYERLLSTAKAKLATHNGE